MPLDPLGVRPEAAAPGEVERQVHAEPVALGHRVDEVAEGHAGATPEVVALAVVDLPAPRAPRAPRSPAATAPAKSPAALTRRPSRERAPRSPPLSASTTKPAPPPRPGAPPEAGCRRRPPRLRPRARPGRLSISAWLSTMPVEGESSPATPRSAGSSARSSAARAAAGRRRRSPPPRRRSGELPLLRGLGRDDDLADPPVRHAAASRNRRRAARARGRRAAPSPSPPDSRCRRGSPRCCASWYGCRSAARPRARPPRARRGRGRAPPRARPPPPRPPRTRPGPSHSPAPPPLCRGFACASNRRCSRATTVDIMLRRIKPAGAETLLTPAIPV